jgi:hypothetical protein
MSEDFPTSNFFCRKNIGASNEESAEVPGQIGEPEECSFQSNAGSSSAA